MLTVIKLCGTHNMYYTPPINIKLKLNVDLCGMQTVSMAMYIKPQQIHYFEIKINHTAVQAHALLIFRLLKKQWHASYLLNTIFLFTPRGHAI